MKTDSGFKNRMRVAARWTLLFIVAMLAFAISTTGGADKAKPLMLIPIVISISMGTDELSSGIVGALCGILLDISTGKLLGSNAILMLIFGVMTSMIFLHLMRKNIINMIIVTIVITFLHGLLDFSFYFVMWNYESYGVVFRQRTLPSFIYTVISSPFIYLIIKFITTKFARPERVVIEQSSESTDKN